MPQTVPLGRDRFIQYLKTDPLAPKQEPARTHEVKGKKRHGEGVAYRLFGPHAVVLGRWTGEPMTTEEKAIHQHTAPVDPDADEDARYNGWGRLIQPEEIDTVANNFWLEKQRRGWVPPRWHWRFYWDRAVVHLVPTHLIHYDTYGATEVQPLAAAQYWAKVLWTWGRLKTGWEPDDGRVEADQRWAPLQVADEPPAEGYETSNWRD